MRAGPDKEAEIHFRPDFATDGLSESELEALGPVLPELVRELLELSSLEAESKEK